MGNFRPIGGASGRTTARLPILTDEHINKFSGATITDRSGLITNGIVDNYAGDKERVYLTQRPSVKIFDDASDTTVDASGRGLYYWSANSTRYFINKGTIYKSTYDNPLTVSTSGALTGTSMADGTSKIYFAEFETVYNKYLFIVNCADGELFVIQNTTIGGVGDEAPINIQDVITDIGTTGTGAPFHASETWDFTGLVDVWDTSATGNGGQCCGAVVLDTYLFLGTKNGKIFNSGVDSFFTWGATDFITAERENDKLLLIEKSKDHLVGFGERSTELFYDAANASNSPLAPRQDIYYTTGIISGQTGWKDGDNIYFVGMKPNGDFHMYTLKDFQLQEDSTSTIDSYLRHGRTEAALTPKLSGFSTGNHTYAILTIFDSSNIPQISLVWDSYTKVWYEWETTLLDNIHFPLITWSIRTPETPTTAEGMFSNGDLFFISDNFEPVDGTDLADAYFAGDYNVANALPADDYSATSVSPEITDNVRLTAMISNIELDSTSTKFLHELKYVGNRTTSSQTLSVEWSDDEGETWYSETIDINKRTQINRLGSFNRRRFRVSYSGDQQLRIEGLDASYTQGTT